MELAELKLAEIADRIHHHLTRPRKDSDFYHPNCHRAGSKIGIKYVAYQHTSKITKREALAYLQALDEGFEGRHIEYLQKNPLPKKEEEILMHVLIKNYTNKWDLYPVVRTSKARYYGPEKMFPSFIRKAEAVLKNATQEDVDALMEMEADKSAAINKAYEEFDRKRKTYLAK